MNLKISDDLKLPEDSAYGVWAFLAKRNVGKTYSAKVLAEEFLERRWQTVVLDPVGVWYGLRSSADGKGPGYPIAIFGGDHGDVPLEHTAGELIADLIAEEGLSCVLDVRSFSKTQRKQFVTDFAERLGPKCRSPLHLFIEEAHMFLPQQARGVERMLGAMNDLTTTYRTAGLNTYLITQRSARLHKDSLEQADVLVALRTVGPNDRKAIKSWIDVNPVDKTAAQDVMGEIPRLPIGDAYLWAPDHFEDPQRLHFRKLKTFDSSATPKAGAARREPKTIADIDVPVLRDRMAATIERAKADDPKELRKQIAQLQRELKTRPTETQEVVKTETVEVPILAAGEIERLEKVAAKLGEWSIDFTTELRSSVTDITDGLKLLPKAETTPRATARPTYAPRSQKPRSTARPPAMDTDIDVDKTFRIAPSHQRILDALAWLEGIGFEQGSRVQVAFLAGYKPSSGGFNNLLGSLRTAGLLTYPTQGYVALTSAGRDSASPSEIPATTEGLQSAVLAKLSPSQGRILSVLIEAYPDVVSRDEIAERTGYSASSGGFNNLLGSLRSMQLIEYPQRGYAAALPVLFLEGA